MTWAINFLRAAKTWLLAILAAVVAVAAAYLVGRKKGGDDVEEKASDQQAAQQATNNAAVAQAAADHAEVRHDVESETAALPDAPAQRVADADPGTAAGQLRDEGWTR
jgi:hypothetical protein